MKGAREAPFSIIEFMQFTQLKEHLGSMSNSGNLSDLEKFVFSSLNDDKFQSEYKYIEEVMSRKGLSSVWNNIGYYSQENSGSNYYQYQELLVEISNSYSAYLSRNKNLYQELKYEYTLLKNEIIKSKKDIEYIQKSKDFITGAEILMNNAEVFKTRSSEYKEQAKNWEHKLILSFVVFATVVIFLFFSNFIDSSYILKNSSDDIKYFGYPMIIAFKAIILLTIVQLIRFFHKNYNANKHLENQTKHKSDVLETLFCIYKTMGSEDQSARNELIKTGALIAFQNVESGYITTKEGAGNADASVFSTIAGIMTKK